MRFGRRIDENMAMIEGGEELGFFRAQHRIAKDIARHVAHAHAGEGLGLNIAIQLAEMTLHRLPGTARRDAHLLVVIALAAAGGEGIAKPETAAERDLIGDVRKCRGALVGGDDKIGIIAVITNHVRRRDHIAIRSDIVGEIEQRAHEGFVGRNACCLHNIARRTWRGSAWDRSRLWRRPER